MADLVDRIRKELDARIEQLRPLVEEFERLQHAAAALARAGTRAVPVVGARPDAKPASRPAGRATRTKPSARRRATVPPRPPAPAAAPPEHEPADRSSPPKPAARAPAARRAGTTAGRTVAPRGQTQDKVLAALRAAQGSTTAAIAATAGIPTNTASATISRLVRQGRVRRLDDGRYAPLEPPPDAAPPPAAGATTDADRTASDTQQVEARARANTSTAE
jgi:hypothetical protein